MITLKPTTTNFLLYKNLVKRFSEDCEIILRNDIDGTEHLLDHFPIEYTRSWVVHFDPLALEGGHYHLFIRKIAQGSEYIVPGYFAEGYIAQASGEPEIIYSEKVYVQ